MSATRSSPAATTATSPPTAATRCTTATNGSSRRLHRDHSVTVSGSHGRVRLPTDYVASDVELGYAQTAHGAQGRTVDRSLTLIDGPVDARGIYVPMTRGRDNNTAYVAVEPGQSARDVLAAGLSRDWIDRPALDVLQEIQRPAPLRPAMLSPQALRDLWDEQRGARQATLRPHTSASIASNAAST